MYLTNDDESLLSGNQGEASQLAMSVLVKLGEIYDAKRMISIKNVHIDASTYYGIYDAGLEFCEKLVRDGAAFRVPATLCIAAIDFERYKEFNISENCVEKQFRLAQAYLKMGAIPNWTCTPYQCGSNVRFGQNIAWGESNAIAFVNSVIGARTIRCADFVDICAAITGRMPQFGLYLDEERLGKIHFDMQLLETSQFTSTDYATLGYYVGAIAGSQVPVLTGVSTNISINQLKAFSAAIATSGSIGMFHMTGITPEARTLNEALGENPPLEVLKPNERDLAEIRDNLSTSESLDPEIVVLGCPHYSAEELAEVAFLLKNKSVNQNKRLWIFTNKCAKKIAEEMGVLKKIEAAGARVICDTCFLHIPTDAWDLDTIATDSAKMAHYAPGIGNFQVLFQNKAQCIDLVTKGILR